MLRASNLRGAATALAPVASGRLHPVAADRGAAEAAVVVLRRVVEVENALRVAAPPDERRVPLSAEEVARRFADEGEEPPGVGVRRAQKPPEGERTTAFGGIAGALRVERAHPLRLDRARCELG